MDYSTGSDRLGSNMKPVANQVWDRASIVQSGFRHHLTEFLEQVSAIMRTGRGFRVILDAKCGKFAMTESFDRLIVQIQMRDFQR